MKRLLTNFSAQPYLSNFNCIISSNIKISFRAFITGLLFILTFIPAINNYGQTTDIYTANGTWTCPLGVTSVTVQCWGAGGGGGGTNQNNRGGGGGGGGEYATATIAVVPGNNYPVVVGVGGIGSLGNGTVGGSSNFNTGAVLANGGGFGLSNIGAGVGGVGGTGGTGTTLFNGGSGANQLNNNYSGGGGGGGGSTASGGNGLASVGGTGGATGGGNGGNGIVGVNGPGFGGALIGGGGGGGYKTGLGNQPGGNGARGQVNITYTISGTAPVFTSCPSNQNLSVDPGSCSAILTYTTVVIATPPPTESYVFTGATTGSGAGNGSGSAFNVGTTTVTITAANGVPPNATCSFTVTVTDDEIPIISCPSDINQSSDPGLCGAIINFNATATDNCPGVTISYVPANGSLLPIGSTTVIATATDASGNTESCAFDVTITDDENPVLICPSDIIQSADPGMCNAVVNYSALVSDNCPGTSVIYVPASGSTFAVGTTTTVIVTATDASGNTDVCAFDVTVVDDEDPIITCPANITQPVDPGLCSAVVTYSASATDNCPGTTIVYVPASGSTFTVGTTLVTATATDASGNTAVCTFNVTVQDNIDPIITCPSNITQPADPGLCTAVVTYSASATDNCPGTTIVYVPASGSAFPVGTTIVTATATDASGNTDVCTFNVTIQDNIDPIITCPSNITQSVDPGLCTAVVTYSASATDNCPGITIVYVPASGSTFTAGTTLVTATATDASGNTDVCTFNVTIQDNIDPIITCPSNITQPVDPGFCTAVVTYSASATDNCPGTTIVYVPASGSTFTVGTTLVTATATDASGNTDICTFNVTVQDNIDPIITCPSNITQSVDPGLCTAVVTFSASATDNCPGTTIAYVPASGSAFPVGTTVVTATATDASGNTDVCTFNVTVQDNIDPIITCPSNITQSVDPGLCTAVVTYSASATDNCPGITIVYVPASGSTFTVGTTLVTATATDASGNTDVCTFNVTVQDNIDPIIICPANITQPVDPGLCTAVVTYSASATDNCPGTTIVYVPASGSTFTVGTTVVTATATDASGNTDVCTFNVTVQDNIDPIITCPANITQPVTPGLCTAVVTFTASATDNCPGTTIAYVPASGSAFPVGTTLVTATATDASGNTDICTFNVTVQDNINPVISCPSDITQSVDPGLCGAVVTYSASATDNCPGTTIVYVPASGSIFPVGTTTVTATATDASGNTDVCAFDVTIVDNEDPIITCPANITQPVTPGLCTTVVTYSASATDNCPGTTIVYVPASGSTFTVGTTVVTATATDASGNTDVCTFNVTVQDNINPIITCPANITQPVTPGLCTAVVTFSASATDNCPGTTIAYVPASGSTFPVGTTVVTATATDASGNTAVCTFNVTVQDNINPIITCPANITQPVTPGLCTAVVTFSASATDNCPGTTIAYVPASGSTFAVGTTLVTATATDASGNTAVCTFNVTVQDNINPIITCPANITQPVTPGLCTAVVTYSASATDNCPGTTIVYVPASGSTFTVGTTLVTATATDASGNTAVCTFNVTVQDNINPIITCPANITQPVTPGLCTAVVTFSASATDNCPGTTIAYVPASGSTFTVGTTVVTATATDASGNTDVCTFNVTVQDNINPIITCPANITQPVTPGLCTAVVTFSASATDNCPGTTIVYVPASGSTFPVGTTVVTATATDASGNTAVCTFNVTVQDNINPIITCPANITQPVTPGLCTTVVTFSASATDNCPGTTIAYVPASGSTFTVGTTVVTATATDASGNTAVCTFNVTVQDNINPIITCPANITQPVTPGLCTAVVTYTASATDNCPGTAIVYVPASGSTFAVGTTLVTATATDASGNTDICTFNVTVQDNINPVISCPSDITQSVDPGLCGAVVTYSASATDNCPGTTIVYVPASGSIFPVGTTTVTATATDVSGNTDVCAFDVTVVDDEDPIITCPANITQPVTPGLCTTVVTYSASATDNCPGTTIVYVPASGSTFTVGTTLVTATATDASGNTDICTFNVIVQDNIDPIITCPSNITQPVDPGLCTAVVTYSASATDNCPGTTIVYVPASGSAFPVGTTFVTATATDASGNTDVCTFNVTVQDNIDPIITCPANITQPVNPGLCSAVVTYSALATDNCPGTTIVYVPASGSTFPIGTTTVTATATDASGNTDVCAFDVTVVDNEDPIITCPANITQPVTPGLCTTVVTYSASATDNCPGTTIVYVPASGSTFTVGTTVVTATATDASGNTDVCTFNVTVQDNIDPIITCPSNITQSVDPGLCTAVVTFSASATDNCPGTAIVYVPASGSTFTIGTTLVTATATDASGNTDICTFNVTVQDNIDPIITCPANITQLVDPGLCSAVVTYSASATDNCPGTTIVYVPASGSTFTVGTTLVTATATDASGNTDVCTFNVTVQDNIDPIITCPSNITQSVDPGLCTAVVTYSASATDNCPGITIVYVPASGSTFTVGTTLVTATATDASGNTDVCTFNVTIQDNIDPIIICPSNITQPIDPGLCTAVVTFSASATDNCSGTTIAYVPASGSTFTVGTTVVTATATDASGNTDVCTFNVTVQDNMNPVISCPADITQSVDPGLCSAIVTYSASATDNCPGTTIVYVPASGSTFPIGTTTVTATATDASGNTDVCAFDVTVVDDEDPIITCPSNITQSVDPGLCSAVVTYSALATDNCPGTTIVYVPASGSTFTVGTTLVTATATDASGNTDVCTFNVTIQDNIDPIITCPANITQSVDPGLCTAVVTYTASATDNCPGTAIVYVPASGSTFTIGTTLVTATATDASGNTDICTFNVTVQDNIDPIITCPSNITQPVDPGLCSAVVTYSASATDNCPGTTIVYVPASGSAFPVGTTLVTATATDASGNTDACTFNVTVQDNMNPVISCPSDITQSVDPGMCSAVVTYSASATDNCPGTTIVYVPASGSIFPVGTTTITATATDASGNTDICAFDVTVVDDEDPIITCPSNITQPVDPGLCTAVVTYTASATDNCPGTAIVYVPASGSTFTIGTTVVTATATDASGNTDVCTFNVIVQDNIDPIITCPSNITQPVDPGLCSAVVTYSASATDNCAGTTIVYVPASGSTFPVGTTLVTATATDASGNTDVCTFNVTVQDNMNPVISCPSDITQSVDPGMCSAVVTYSASATDNCPGTTIVYVPASGSIFPIGTTTITATATDASGNTDVCAFDVTVVDDEDPIVTCPSNITQPIDPGLCTAVVTYSASATDNCPGTTIVYVPASGSTFTIGTTLVTVTATDASGNTDICTFNVTVQDNIDPVISCPADITQSVDPGLCSAVVTYSASATDNCPGTTIVYVPASGSIFPVGTTTVTATATDASGNTDVCAFDVTVNDTEAPVVSCPSDITVGSTLGMCGANVSFVPTASDNCAGVTIASVPASGSFFPIGTTIVTVTATDASGNTDICAFDVTVNDTEDPIVTCPSDITVGSILGMCGSNVSYVPTATDNCGGVTITSVPASGSFFPVGTTVVTVTATDASLNTDICTFNVTVNDTENPVVTCPSDITIVSAIGMCGSNVNFVPTATDNCGGVTITSVPASGSFFPVGTTVVTVTATDASGNTDICSFNVTVNDTEDPVITCPSNINVGSTVGMCGAVVNYVSPVVTDNCPGVTTIQTLGLSSGSVFPVGVTTNTFTSTDASGNIASCSFTVTVNDTENPTITCPATQNLNLDATCSAILPDYTSLATTGDNCGVASVTQSPLPGSTVSGAGIQVVTLTVTDIHANIANCNFNVTLTDITPPSIVCAANQTQSNDLGFCSANVTVVGPTFADNCGPVTITNSFNGTANASGIYPVGTTTITWTATDGAGLTATCAQTVTITDNEAPVIVCSAPITQSNDPGICGAVVNYIVPVGIDNCPGVTTIQTAGLPSGALFPVGVTINTFTSTDAAGNTSSCSFTVTVNDTEAPVASCTDITVNTAPGLCGRSVNYTVAFTDNCPGGTIVQTDGTGYTNGNFFPVGTTLQSYLITDGSGNTSTCSFNVIVIDNEVPLIVCPSNISVNNTPGICGANITMVQPVYSDNCNILSVINNYNGTSDGSGLYPIGTTTVVWTVTDINSNFSTCSMTVTVADTEVPSITCASDQTQTADPGVCNANITVVSPVVNDNCGFTSVINNYNGTANASDNYPVGTTTVLWTVTDINGNTNICTQLITVTDDELPTIACAPDQTQTAGPGVCNAVVTVVAPATNDNCGVTSIVNDYNFTSDASDIYPAGTTAVTWTVTDASGNINTCVQLITVTDNTAPVPTVAVLPVVVGQCSATAPMPTAMDNCAGPINGTTTDPTSYNTQGIFTITWTYDDGNGNTSSQTQTVIIDDTIAPVPTVASLPTITAECTATVIPPTAFDNCEGVITATTTDPTTYSTEGTFIITWTYDDGNGNTSSQTQTVIINDVTAPVPTVASLPTITAECTATVTPPTALDNCAGTVTATTTDPTTYSTAGTFIITWTYDDGNGNTSSQTQTVIINDITAPVANVSSLPTVTGQCSATVSSVPTATDNCSGPVTGTTTSPLTYSVQGTYTITWIYDDGNGNTSTQPQTVVVDDTTAPVPDVATLPTVSGQCSVTVSGTPTATDLCVGGITGTTTDPLTYSSPGTYTITWTYNDGNGNASSQPQTVIVNDAIAPVPDVATLPTVTGQCSATVLAPPTATDNCNGTITGTTFNPLTYTAQGTYTITWTYNDGNGNSTIQNQTVVVDDVTPAVANVASLPTITAPCSVTLTPPTATDNCTGTITANTFDPLTYNVQGTYTVTWIYFDGNGNTSTQTQTVIINDNVAPVANMATLPTVTGQCSATVSTAPTATDNCSGLVTGTTTDPLSYNVEGTYTITWTYMDVSSNVSTQTQTVIVDDNISPVPDASSLPNITGSCSATASTIPTATDNCAGSITATTTDPLTYTAGTNYITWKFDDGNGNISTQTQMVIITDNTSPVPSASFLPNVVGNCAVTVFTAPTANDNCVGLINGTTTDALSYNIPGSYTITWRFDDGNGNIFTQNQTVIVNPCLGVDPSGEAFTANIYPNPSTGIFTISLNSIPDGKAEIRVIDDLGQVVYVTPVQAQIQVIDLSYLKAATYYVQLLSTQGNFTKTIIITHQY